MEQGLEETAGAAADLYLPAPDDRIGITQWAASRDLRLSLEACGLMNRILASRGRVIAYGELQALAPVGRAKFQALERELEKYGYLTRVRSQGADGKFTWRHEVHGDPEAEKRAMGGSTPQAENRPLDYTVGEYDRTIWWPQYVEERARAEGWEAARALREINVESEILSWRNFTPENGRFIGWRHWMGRAIDRWRSAARRPARGAAREEPRGPAAISYHDQPSMIALKQRMAEGPQR